MTELKEKLKAASQAEAAYRSAFLLAEVHRQAAHSKVCKLIDLAECTRAVLAAINTCIEDRLVSCFLTNSPITTWERRKELEPLANSLGYTISAHPTLVNNAIIKELP